MAVREDVVSSAVTFLQDPSVSSAPLDRRIAFLQSKNLTQEEIDVSLARAGESPAQPGASYGYGQAQGPVVRQQGAPPPQYGNGGYNPYGAGYWAQPPPPEPPRRDWRDYFIMATVMGGLSYGVYFVAKRYIAPLIAPPTPPQLEQDKSAIDDSFARAFTLIEQLSNDTAEIKTSEEARKQRLDAALADVENVIRDLKLASKRRDDDSRRIGDDVRNLQAMIPKAMKTQEENTDARLKELNVELRGLKTLISNRMTGNGAATSSVKSNGVENGSQSIASPVSQPVAAVNKGVSTPSETSTTAAPSSKSASTLGRFAAGKGGIPAWQQAAQKKSEQESAVKESGTVAEASLDA